MFLRTPYRSGAGLRMRSWCSAFPAICALPVVVGLAAELNPPQPNPADPIDYIAWINETLGGAVKSNAADAYLAAYEKIERFEGDWGETLDGPWADNEAVSNWLDANRKGLKKFRKAAKKRACFFRLVAPEQRGDLSAGGGLISVQLPPLQTHRDAFKALIAEGYRDWHQGRQNTLPNNTLVILRSAHHLDRGLTLVGRLVGIYGRDLGYRALWNALRLSDDPDKLATRMVRKLEHADPPSSSFDEALLLERLCLWDLCQRLFTPGPRKGTYTISPATLRKFVQQDTITGADQQAFARIGYDETLREVNAYYDALERWFTSPYYLAQGQLGQLESTVRDSKNPFVKAFTASLARVRLLSERCTAERRATHLLVYLFVHHGKTNKFPQSLDELKASDLAELRVDPFSGRDFVYQTKGDSFTLYSVADNLSDDGAKHDPKWKDGDFVFWPVPQD